MCWQLSIVFLTLHDASTFPYSKNWFEINPFALLCLLRIFNKRFSMENKNTYVKCMQSAIPKGMRYNRRLDVWTTHGMWITDTILSFYHQHTYANKTWSIFDATDEPKASPILTSNLRANRRNCFVIPTEIVLFSTRKVWPTALNYDFIYGACCIAWQSRTADTLCKHRESFLFYSLNLASRQIGQPVTSDKQSSSKAISNRGCLQVIYAIGKRSRAVPSQNDLLAKAHFCNTAIIFPRCLVHNENKKFDLRIATG